MTEFERIAVLVSIVIGLGLTQLLTNVYQLVQARERVKAYWLPIVWAIVLFIAMVEWWWYLYELREQAEHWTFFYFLFVLLSPVTLYMAAAFALPEPHESETTDMRQYYYHTHRYFFAMVAAGPMLDAIRRAHEAGSLTDFGAVSNAISGVMLATLAFTARPRYHVAITSAVIALFTYFLIATAVK